MAPAFPPVFLTIACNSMPCNNRKRSYTPSARAHENSKRGEGRVDRFSYTMMHYDGFGWLYKWQNFLRRISKRGESAICLFLCALVFAILRTQSRQHFT